MKDHDRAPELPRRGGPSRRAFMAALAAAVAAVQLRDRREQDRPKALWIGHC